MQYYKIKKGEKRERISKGDFLNIYNQSRIIAIRPIQNDSFQTPIQMDVYVK